MACSRSMRFFLRQKCFECCWTNSAICSKCIKTFGRLSGSKNELWKEFQFSPNLVTLQLFWFFHEGRIEAVSFKAKENSISVFAKRKINNPEQWKGL